MGVARRGLNIAVAKELADHWKRLAHRQGRGRKGVAEVVNSHIGQFVSLSDTAAGMLDVGKVEAREFLPAITQGMPSSRGRPTSAARPRPPTAPTGFQF